MKGLRPLATACAVTALLCGGVVAYAELTGVHDAVIEQHKRPAVSISGHVDNLQPGIPAVLRATARNNTRRPLRLRRVSAQVGNANIACPRTFVQAGRYRGRSVIEPRQSIVVPIQVVLSTAAPDQCQDATFPIRFRARLRRVPPST